MLQLERWAQEQGRKIEEYLKIGQLKEAYNLAQRIIQRLTDAACPAPHSVYKALKLYNERQLQEQEKIRSRIIRLEARYFEFEVAMWMTRAGYQAKVTKQSRDDGVDVLATQNDEKIVIQCKRWERPVGPNKVRELSGALKYWNADRALLVTTSYFTDAAVDTYLAKLTEEVPFPSSVEQYCNIILDNALKREIILVGNEIIKLAYESPSEAVNILDEAQLKMKEIKHNRYRSFTTCSDLISSNYQRYEDLHNRSGAITGISSGFYAIDSLTCGFQDSDLIIIAGRPSQGKTALAASMVAAMASDGISCGIFSLEMSASQLCDRLIALESRVNTTKFRNGRFSKENWEAIAYAAGKMNDWDFVVDDTPGLSHMELRRQARRMVSQHGIKILFIDYLQLMSGNNKRGRVEEYRWPGFIFYLMYLCLPLVGL
jgi:hypothetical protein